MPAAFGTGCLPFAATTTALAALSWPAVPTFLLVLAALIAGFAITRRARRTGRTINETS